MLLRLLEKRPSVLIGYFVRNFEKGWEGGGGNVAFLLTDTYTRLDLKLDACGVV